MEERRLDRKYYGLIWLFAVIAALASNVYSIYASYIDVEDVEIVNLTLNIILTILFSGFIPAAIYYLVPCIIYAYGYRRYARAVGKNDFVYTTMFFTCIVKVVCGIVSALGIIEPLLYSISSGVLEPILLFVAYIIMFFKVFVKQYQFNPAEKMECFKNWSVIYFILFGIVTIINFGATFLYGAMEELLEETGYDTLVITNGDKWIAIAAFAVFVIALIVDIIIAEKIKKEAAEYTGPTTRDKYMKMRDDFMKQGFAQRMENDSRNIFGMDGNDYSFGNDENKNDNDDDHHNDGGNVFDEFDI